MLNLPFASARMARGGHYAAALSGAPAAAGFDFSNSYSLAFDGTNDNLNLGDIGDFDEDDPFTYSFWMKTADTGYQIFFGKSSSSYESYRGIFLYYNYPGADKLGLIFANSYSGNMIFVSTPAISALRDDSWHHIGVTYDGSTDASGINIYTDGSAQTLTTHNDTLDGTTLNDIDLWVGGRHGSYNQPVLGNMDEFSIHDAELDATNIAAVYNSGAPINLRSDSGGYDKSSNLLGWWQMGDGGTWDGSNWTIPDVSTNSNDGTTDNMDENDREEEVPS
jgi:hypothetical protein